MDYQKALDDQAYTLNELDKEIYGIAHNVWSIYLLSISYPTNNKTSYIIE